LVPEYQMYGHVRERSGAALPGISPSNTYVCGDRNYIVIAANGDGIFRRLMRAMSRDDLADDPRLAHNDGRVIHNEMLDAAITAWTRERTLEGALEVLEGAGVPSGKVYSAADIVGDPHYRAREMIERYTLPNGDPIEVPGIVPKLSATPGRTNWLGPALGAHTEEVLASIGIDQAEFARLRAANVIS
jgi:crotonobetainyl-CoA:carnitine CoA-transferase CaiB-like acyl-CoA transferase